MKTLKHARVQTSKVTGRVLRDRIGEIIKLEVLTRLLYRCKVSAALTPLLFYGLTDI